MSGEATSLSNEMHDYWKLISKRNMDAAAYDEAQRWLAEHPGEVKELDNMIASNDRKARRHRADQTVEQTEYRRTYEYNPEAILPPEVRHALYDDMRWFDRAAYMPEDAEDESERLYLPTGIVVGLHELSERQREILFRTVINGEPTESVAQSLGCSPRNILYHKNAAIMKLQTKLGKRKGEGYLPDSKRSLLFILILLGAAALLWAITKLFPMQDTAIPAWGTAIICILAISGYLCFRRREVIRKLRWHWISLNGGIEKR